MSNEKKKAIDPFIHFDKINVSVSREELTETNQMLTFFPRDDKNQIIFTPDMNSYILDASSETCDKVDMASEKYATVSAIEYDDALTNQLSRRFFTEIDNNVKIIYEGNFKELIKNYINEPTNDLNMYIADAQQKYIATNIFSINHQFHNTSTDDYLRKEELLFACGALKRSILTSIQSEYQAIISILLNNNKIDIDRFVHDISEGEADYLGNDGKLAYAISVLNEQAFKDICLDSDIVDAVTINIFSYYESYFINIPEQKQECIEDNNGDAYHKRIPIEQFDLNKLKLPIDMKKY